MLIYRQIRPDNRIFLQENELPQHVQKLVASLGKEELREKELKEFKHNMCKVSQSIDRFPHDTRLKRIFLLMIKVARFKNVIRQ